MNPAAKHRWQRLVQVIIIEECSLLSASFLELLDEVGRQFRDSQAAFDGIRVILVGDVAQLAPVPEWHTCTDPSSAAQAEKKTVEYMFQSEAFEGGGFKCLRLKNCHRYDSQSDLGRLLTRLRVATRVDDDMHAVLEDRMVNSEVDADADGTVVLCCTKENARKRSEFKMKNLKDPATGQSVPQKLFFGVDRIIARGSRWVF